MRLARGIVAATLIFGAVASSGAEEPPVVPAPNVPFRSMDEASGWVKAKGKCEASKDPEFHSCMLWIPVAPRSSEDKLLSPGWGLDAYLATVDHGPKHPGLRQYEVAIRRRRTCSLSARDPDATLTTLKISRFQFNHEGNMQERTVRLIVRAATGENVFDIEYPVPLVGGAGIDAHEDIDILRNQTGVQWYWFKGSR